MDVRWERAYFNYIIFFVLLHLFVVLFLSLFISSLHLELKSLFGFLFSVFKKIVGKENIDLKS